MLSNQKKFQLIFFNFFFFKAKGYHDHAKPESKTPSELRKATAFKQRKFSEKRRQKMERARRSPDTKDFFCMPEHASGFCPTNSTAEMNPAFKCTGRKTFFSKILCFLILKFENFKDVLIINV